MAEHVRRSGHAASPAPYCCLRRGAGQVGGLWLQQRRLLEQPHCPCRLPVWCCLPPARHPHPGARVRLAKPPASHWPPRHRRRPPAHPPTRLCAHALSPNARHSTVIVHQRALRSCLTAAPGVWYACWRLRSMLMTMRCACSWPAGPVGRGIDDQRSAAHRPQAEQAEALPGSRRANGTTPNYGCTSSA